LDPALINEMPWQVTITFDENDIVEDSSTCIGPPLYCAEDRSQLRVEALHRRAEDGNAAAQYALGIKVYSDEPQAWKWFCLAAQQGHPEAQFQLATFYRRGWYPTKDAVKAYQWYMLADENGSQHAGEEQTKLQTEMTSAEVAEAESLAAAWEPNPSECETQTTADATP
jgi:TPR repeat protein